MKFKHRSDYYEKHAGKSLEPGTRKLKDGRVVRTVCGSGHPFDGEHNQSCPVCEDIAYKEYRSKSK